ncbi:hypothetical protein CR513_19040, partial [Mucuna pruriens]
MGQTLGESIQGPLTRDKLKKLEVEIGRPCKSKGLWTQALQVTLDLGPSLMAFGRSNGMIATKSSLIQEEHGPYEGFRIQFTDYAIEARSSRFCILQTRVKGRSLIVKIDFDLRKSFVKKENKNKRKRKCRKRKKEKRKRKHGVEVGMRTQHENGFGVNMDLAEHGKHVEFRVGLKKTNTIEEIKKGRSLKEKEERGGEKRSHIEKRGTRRSLGGCTKKSLIERGKRGDMGNLIMKGGGILNHLTKMRERFPGKLQWMLSNVTNMELYLDWELKVDQVLSGWSHMNSHVMHWFGATSSIERSEKGGGDMQTLRLI